MRLSFIRIIPALLVVVATCLTSAYAGDKDANGEEGEVVETIEVKRAESKDTKHETLRFLKDNRVFLRARLDQLRTQVTLTRTERAELLDERYLRLQEMAAAIAAARDTVQSEHMLTPQRDLLNSVTELGELEAELILMEQILADQRTRLLVLEEDFLGQQETALVILLKGLADKDVPESVVIAQDNNVVRVHLTPEQRLSLEQGGIAQLYHEFVEPREHVFEVSFTGGDWVTAGTILVPVEATRDRITFLELDLSRIDRKGETLGLLTSVWYR
jgi:hypothetical protein